MYWHCRKRDAHKGQAICLAFFIWSSSRRATPEGDTMTTKTYSKTRQEAEIAFGKTQTEFFSRGKASESLNTIAQARDEKTRRLREARRAKELDDQLSVMTATARKDSN
jgi:hypothetical protein